MRPGGSPVQLDELSDSQPAPGVGVAPRAHRLAHGPPVRTPCADRLAHDPPVGPPRAHGLAHGPAVRPPRAGLAHPCVAR